MKTVSKIFYIIAAVLGVAAIISCISMGCTAISAKGDATMIQKIIDQANNVQLQTADQVKSALSSLATFCFVYSVVEIAAFILNIFGLRTLNDDEGSNKAIHIVNIILAFCGLNVFLLLGSVFGLASSGSSAD